MNVSSLNAEQRPLAVGNGEPFENAKPPRPPFSGNPVEREGVNWEEVHQLIQRRFDELTGHVSEHHPEIRARSGFTMAGAVYLFSYRDFDVPRDHAIEAIAAGVDFQKGPGDDSVTVRGDIVREDTGDILFETAQRVLPLTRSEVLAAAEETARALSERATVILDGLEQPGVCETD